MINMDFFNRNAKEVAKDLLGFVLVRKLKNGKELRARIIETEAYFDENDPASRACQNGDLRKTMEMSAGTVLVYGVHNNWLLNFVTEEKGKPSAVLIRSLKPLNFDLKCSGPGLLTKAMKIDKLFHKKHLSKLNELGLEKGMEKDFNISKGFRIGIKKDLPEKLRFFVDKKDLK